MGQPQKWIEGYEKDPASVSLDDLPAQWVKDGVLQQIGLETIGACNSKCVFCEWGNDPNVIITRLRTGEKIVRKHGKIDLSLIDAIFEKHPQLCSVTFTGLCEPFLAPDRMVYIADKLAKRNNASMAMYTNGNLFDETSYRILLASGLLKFFSVSLNAGTTATRMKVMNLPFEPAFANLKRAIEIRDEMGLTDQCKICSSFMICPQNREEEGLFKAKVGMLFKKYKNVEGGCVFHATNWNGKVKDYWMVPHRGPEKGGYCRQWECLVPTISVEGEVYHCCYTDRWSYGSILDDAACKAWARRNAIAKVNSAYTETFPTEMCGDCSHKFTLDYAGACTWTGGKP